MINRMNMWQYSFDWMGSRVPTIVDMNYCYADFQLLLTREVE